MLSNWDESFKLVIQSEGGFTNDQKDKGNHLPDGREGCTMLGCTQAVWETYVGKQVTQEEMKQLKADDVKPLYKKNYWDSVRGDDLPVGMDYAVFDFAINAGPNAARKMTQTALGVTSDGVFGPATLNAIKNANGVELLGKFTDAKVKFYQGLSNFDVYGKGWLKRCSHVQQVATEMIG
ncbi:zliS Lysozyme family protein [uncultured Caudovirales phage]|uniref:ZliS Lysozyme family protein n=1 Tax=uncultured Caudovirales phage TaxID=2100421 RepID=A0A6J5MZV9_9CAUD|nr:zliS Lysozyme family protein [uncultured Caudovirales phage]